MVAESNGWRASNASRIVSILHGGASFFLSIKAKVN